MYSIINLIQHQTSLMPRHNTTACGEREIPASLGEDDGES